MTQEVGLRRKLRGRARLRRRGKTSKFVHYRPRLARVLPQLPPMALLLQVDDASGEIEAVEAALGGIPGVGGVETTEVTLL